MKAIAIISLIIFSVFAVTEFAGSHTNRCGPGTAQGFAALRDNPDYLVGTIPSRYTRDPTYFDVRYNCLGKGVLVRRVSTGVYDVKFNDLRARGVVATILAEEGGSASAWHVTDGEFRIIIRGPLVESNVILRRDVAFTIVVY